MWNGKMWQKQVLPFFTIFPMFILVEKSHKNWCCKFYQTHYFLKYTHGQINFLPKHPCWRIQKIDLLNIPHKFVGCSKTSELYMTKRFDDWKHKKDTLISWTQFDLPWNTSSWNFSTITGLQILLNFTSLFGHLVYERK